MPSEPSKPALVLWASVVSMTQRDGALAIDAALRKARREGMERAAGIVEQRGAAHHDIAPHQPGRGTA